jgi:nucleoside-triphosphatase THEP1
MGSKAVTPLAAIRFNHEDSVDDLLEFAARALQTKGVSVTGYLQRETEDASCCNITHLEDLSDGALYRISQALGSGSRGCRLDPTALAEVSGMLHTTLETGTDFLVLNRFGKGESEGQGFRAAIEKALDMRTPVLTAVREAYAAAWEEFTDGSAVLLPPDKVAILDWAQTAVEDARARQSAA